jgi:hypothetical protein
MAANGISTLANKQLRQAAKLAIATAKRQGKVVAVDGTITGSADDTKTYYRAANTLDIDLLPTKYNVNGLTDNANTGGLVAGRPWSATDPAPDSLGSMFIPGTSSRITLSSGIVVGSTSTTPFTVEGWFYSTVTPGTNSGPVLLSTNTASSNPTYAKALTINISSTTQIIVDSNGAASQAFNFAETMLVNTWYYVAVTRDSSGYIQVWLGKDGDANATASTTGRRPLNNDNWNLTGLSNCIGAFVPAGRYTTGYISNLRVGTTALYATDAATIPVPTEAFTELASTVFLQNDDTLTDQTGTRTLAAVGIAAGDDFNPFDYSGKVISGLVLHLDAGNATSYPGSGTTWTDPVSSASATLTGSPAYNAQTGFTFNGTTQYARMPSSDGVTNFGNTDAYTVEVWFNPDAGQPSATLATVLEKWNSTNQGRYPYVFRYNQTSGVMQVAAYDGVNNPTSTVSGVTTGGWQQVVGVFDFVSDVLTPYRNGSAGSTVSLVGVNQVSNTSLVGIAHRINTGGETQFMFKGSIGIVRIYNTALTSAQVLQNYNAMTDRYGL